MHDARRHTRSWDARHALIQWERTTAKPATSGREITARAIVAQHGVEAHERVCRRAQSTVDSLFFIDVPTNPGPRSFCAWAVRRCHWPVPQPIVRLLPSGLLKSTNSYPISRDLDPGMSPLTLPSSTSRRPRRDMPQLEPKHNLKPTLSSNSC